MPEHTPPERVTLLWCSGGSHGAPHPLLPGDENRSSPALWMGRCVAHNVECEEVEYVPAPEGQER